MQTVEVSYTVDLPVEDVRVQLTPEAILECAEVYEIESVETVGETVTITTSFQDAELVFSFSAIDDGYEYTMIAGENLFAERYSRIIVTDLGETRIAAETRFTLDTWLSVVLDRLSKGTVRSELDTVIVNLVERAMDDADDEPTDAANERVDGSETQPE